MTDRNRQRTEIALLALVFGMGGGWAAFQLKLATLAEQVDRIDARVSAMYCNTVPEAIRAGCK